MANKASKKFAKDDLIFLAGIVTSTPSGLKGTNTTNAALISTDAAFIQALVTQFGGEHREFVSNAGKAWQGWFVDLETRKALLEAISPHWWGDISQLDTAIGRISKAINSLKAREK